MEPGLDFAFLNYIGVTPENQRPVRRYYLPMFEGCRRVVDLGCGNGDFVALLRERGIDAFGVDADPLAAESLRGKNLPIVEQDIIDYLKVETADSLDGIYAAHLVEHLPYEVVLNLIRLAFRALKPGGRLVLATPDPRAILSHLEFYHLHFGHEAFYHPRLLSFFMDYCGFEGITDGANPHTPSLLRTSAAPAEPPVRFRGFPPIPGNPLRNLIRRGKTLVYNVFIEPLIYDLLNQVNQNLTMLRAMDRPFECYVSGFKPGGTGHEPTQ